MLPVSVTGPNPGLMPPFEPDDEHMNPPLADIRLLDSLVPLIPLRTPKSTVTEDNPLSASVTRSRPHAATTTSEADSQWSILLSLAARHLVQENKLDAAKLAQCAHAWRNDFEAITGQRVSVTSSNWVTLAACSLALEECDSAAAFAVRAWETSGLSWQDDLQDDCCDVRADAMALLAIVRVFQHRADRATGLIQQAISQHRQVGAMEQLAADQMILSVCKELCGDTAEAADARTNARRIVETSLDPSRHERSASLSRWMKRFGHPRPVLLKSSEIV